jgi:hypothetical protein
MSGSLKKPQIREDGLVEAAQDATAGSVEVAFADQVYQGEKAQLAASAHGLDLVIVRLPEAKRGFVLLPTRWVVERSRE